MTNSIDNENVLLELRELTKKKENWETKIDDVETSKGGEFVDLNLDNLYLQNENKIKCPYCGYENDNNMQCCEVCGTKLKGEDDGQNN